MTIPDVVVGVYGSAGSDQAVRLAAHRELPLRIVHALRLTVPQHGVGIAETGTPWRWRSTASVRGVPLYAWHDDAYGSMYAPNRYLAEWNSIESDEHKILAERLAGWQEKYPDVEVRRALVRDRPRHALMAWSATARLVVVGSRGRGGFRGMLLGSTSQALVLVVRHRPGE